MVFNAECSLEQTRESLGCHYYMHSLCAFDGLFFGLAAGPY